jgi:predicted DNA-binding transcriptional regulator AlpA
MSRAVRKYSRFDLESYLIGPEGKSGAAFLAASVRDVLIRITDVCAITGLSVPSIYRLMSRNAFPRPLKISGSARVWKLSEIMAGWIAGNGTKPTR